MSVRSDAPSRQAGGEAGLDTSRPGAAEARRDRRSPWARRALVAVAFAAAVVAMLRRTPSQLAHRLPGDLGDSALVQWILGWGAHGLAHDPLHVFDANIFWPNPHTLAYADSLLSLAPAYAVLHGLTGNWTLSWNLMWIGLIGLNLGATYSLTRWLTGRTDAGLFAACAAGFSAFVLGQANHPQLQVVGLVPLGFLVLFKLLERPRLLMAVGFGAVNVVIALSSLYVATGYAISVVVILVGFVLLVRGRIGRQLLVCLLVAGAVTLIAAPSVIPYRQVEQVYGQRPLYPKWGLRPRDIVRPPVGSYLYHSLSRDTDEGSGERHDFPGFSTLALAGVGLVALVWPRRRRRLGAHSPPLEERADAGPDRARFLALLTAAGAVIGLLAVGAVGTSTPTPWRFAYRLVPPLAGVRVPARLVFISILAAAVLAGAGLGAITRRIRPAALRTGVAGAACVLVLVELAAPVHYATLPQDQATLAVYQALSHRPSGAAVELPIPKDPLQDAFTESPRMVWSTIDFHPRLNGYSGYLPSAYFPEAMTLDTVPAPAAFALARSLRLRYMILHTGVQTGTMMYTQAQADAIVQGLPAGASAVRYGPNYLVDLGPAA